MKTLHSIINDAEIKRQYRVDIINNPDELSDRGKTNHEAEFLANYFEGIYDALCEEIGISNKR